MSSYPHFIHTLTPPKKLIKSIIYVIPFFLSCNHTNRRLSENPAQKQDVMNQGTLNNFEQKLDSQPKSSDPKSGSSPLNHQGMWGLVDTMLLQNQLYIRDSFGKAVSLVEYRQAPAQYFILFESSTDPNSYLALHTSPKDSAPKPKDTYTLDYKFYRVAGHPSSFQATRLGNIEYSTKLALDQSAENPSINISAINSMIQAALDGNKLSGLPSLGDLYSLFFPSLYASSSNERGFLIAAIVLASVSTVSYWNAYNQLGRLTAVAAITAGFFYWLRKPTKYDPPVRLADSYPRPIDLNESPDSKCTSETAVTTRQQIAAYAPMMGNERHRFYHFTWHSLRNSWHALTNDQRDLVHAIDPNLVVKRPLQGLNFFDRFRDKYDPFKNGAGEEFLFMHRQMVQHVKRSLIAKNLPCIGAWKSVPLATDPNNPVPNYNINSVKSPYTQQIMEILERDYFHNQKWLASQKLSAVGHSLEFSLHGLFHIRWADTQSEFRNRPYFNSASLMRIPAMYLQTSANYLADPFQAHVNPFFWKLHGYVDDVVNRWLVAKGYKYISKNCGARSNCYQWSMANEAYKYEHLNAMTVLEKFRAYAVKSRSASNQVSKLFESIEPYQIKIAEQPATDTKVIEKVFQILRKANVPAEDALRIGSILISPRE